MSDFESIYFIHVTEYEPPNVPTLWFDFEDFVNFVKNNGVGPQKTIIVETKVVNFLEHDGGIQYITRFFHPSGDKMCMSSILSHRVTASELIQLGKNAIKKRLGRISAEKTKTGECK